MLHISTDAIKKVLGGHNLHTHLKKTDHALGPLFRKVIGWFDSDNFPTSSYHSCLCKLLSEGYVMPHKYQRLYAMIQFHPPRNLGQMLLHHKVIVTHAICMRGERINILKVK